MILLHYGLELDFSIDVRAVHIIVNKPLVVFSPLYIVLEVLLSLLVLFESHQHWVFFG